MNSKAILFFKTVTVLSVVVYLAMSGCTSGDAFKKLPSGLEYKMDFDNQLQPEDQQFEDKGVKLVTDLRSFLYVCNTTLDFSDGLNGKGFEFKNPNASRTCACGESFAV